MMERALFKLLAVLVLTSQVWTGRAHAGQAEVEQAVGLLASETHTDVAKGIADLATADPEKALVVLGALEAGDLKKDGRGVVFVSQEGGKLLQASTLAEVALSGTTREISLNNTTRRALSATLSKLRLTAKSVEVRRTAAKQLAEYPDFESAAVIRTVIDREKDAEARRWMSLALAKVDLKSDDRNLRIQAAKSIQDSDDISLEAELKTLVGKDDKGKYGEPDAAVRVEMDHALQSVQRRIFFINVIANTIYGLSLGSVLLLAALGLAITFGLMKVINMAHGEMLMLGAYSTYFVRERMLGIGTDFAEYYLILAIPFAFATTFAMGVLLERLVIRHLYGRPLETLLSTWGLSLILIQVVRVVFGAQNVTVANPNWLSGGVELMPALVVPYSRIAVLSFTLLVVGFVWFVLRGTSVGLKVRAVTQNREIAASLGIATNRVDMWTFGLGSGLAGLGGVALSQLGNVGPELGQQHIIDSFVVVVVGGVGNILGTIFAGFGLGLANKILEPSVGAVMGKILLLVLLIFFIQWRPQGLFALKGRAAEN
jgi:urea transport system permease protein